MEKYLIKYRRNVELIDSWLRVVNQGFLKPTHPKSFLGWIRHTWPIWYCGMLSCFYFYLIFVHGKKAGLVIISGQIWAVMCVVQAFSKLINGVFQVKKLQDLFKWCEECYTMDYGEYTGVVTALYKKRDHYITYCIRFMSTLIFIASCIYLFTPLVLGVRETPTQVSINGNDYWPNHIFAMIYLVQFFQFICVIFGMTTYDNIFILFTMTMAQRFSTMCEILNLLNYEGERDHRKDRKVLGDLYKMHLSVLNATALFRSYYFFYGLVQLGTNVMANCSTLYILQMVSLEFLNVSILAASCIQVFMASMFGQLVQDEASDWGDALYNVDWMNMSMENKKRLLLLMTGSVRDVNIRAGGTYELNRALFCQVMKAGATLCAVLKAV